jgi:ABC-type maltose transport system permease subunit
VRTAVVTAILPIVAIFLLFQRFFVKGIAVTCLKG